MQVNNNFIGSKMNKDVDERLVENGIMTHAENIRIFSTEGSDAGVAETVLGNTRLTHLGLTNAMVIGSTADWANQLIYALITADEKDIVIEYDIINKVTTTLVEGLRVDGKTWMNFNRHYLVNSLLKIVNDNSDKDLLIFTDNYNNVRMFNINRAKLGLITQEKDWKLIKSPPRYPIRTEMTFSDTAIENNLSNKFLSFMYRFVFEDGEYSAFSGFTNYKFSPSRFDIDFETMENKGMINQFNAINLFFNTGDYLVKEIEIAFKESQSNSIYLIERFNKKDQGWSDDTEQYFKFTNNKIYAQLDSHQLTRSYDAVPRKAKTIGLAQNRLVIANYLEGYNMVDVDNQKVVMDYNLLLRSSEIGSEALKTILTPRTLTVTLSANKLKYDSKLGFDFYLIEDDSNPLSATSNFYTEYILNKEYGTLNELLYSDDFQHYLNVIVNTYIIDNLKEENTFPPSASISVVEPFKVISVSNDSFVLEGPTLVLKYYSDPNDPTSQLLYKRVPLNYSTKNVTTVTYNNVSINASVKSYRSYEAGILYMDEDSRTTPTLTCANNTLFVPLDKSSKLNKIQAVINHKPPYFADRYKFVIKQSKGDYETLYVNRFYQDGIYRWVALDGANKNKVKDGDILIVKSDLGGVLETPIKVRVLEILHQEQNFISGRDNPDLKELREVAGLYMKIKPSGFDMNYREGTSRTYEGSSHLRYPVPTYSSPAFGQTIDGVFKPYVIGAGSTVRMYLQFKAQGNIAFNAEYDKKWVIANHYTSFKEFFENEVVTLGDFGLKHTNGVKFNPNRPAKDQVYKTAGGTYGIGYGFNEEGKQFFIYSQRDGTQSRSITTTVKIEIYHSDGTLIFETEADDVNSDIFYETEDIYDIKDGKHMSNITNQTDTSPAIVDINFYNCFTQGNGAESYKYLDDFNTNSLNIDLRPTAVILEPYSEIYRNTDLTYSEPYVENNGVNGLNEFNLSRVNYKDDMIKAFGPITHIMEDDTDLLVFQEDKVSKLLVGKNMINSVNGGSTLTTTDSVLNQQVPYAGTYGTLHPESIAQDANSKYYVDVKRGTVMRLGGNGNEEISDNGMHAWFRDFLPPLMNSPIFGAFDPHYNEYVVSLPEGLITKRVDVNCDKVVSLNDFEGTLFVNYKLKNVTGEYKLVNTGNQLFEYILYDNLNNIITQGTTLDFRYTYLKTDMSVTELTLVVKSLEDTNFSIMMNCPVLFNKHFTTVVINDSDNTGKSTSVRWKSYGAYTTPYKDYPITLIQGETLSSEVVGNESNILIPPNENILRMEMLKFPDVIEWNDNFKMVVIKSNTALTKDELNQQIDITNSLNVIQNETMVYADTEIVYENREEFFYICYVMNQLYSQMVAVNDNASCKSLESVTIDVLTNDTYTGDVIVEITESPLYGTVSVVNNEVIYTNTEMRTSDSFKYKIRQGDRYSNEANVVINIDVMSTVSDEFSFSEKDSTSNVIDFLVNDNYNKDITIDIEFIGSLQYGTITENEGVYTYTLNGPLTQNVVDVIDYRIGTNGQWSNTSTITINYSYYEITTLNKTVSMNYDEGSILVDVLADSIYDPTEVPVITLVEPLQGKSIIGEKGEFSIENNKIKYTITGSIETGYSESVKFKITNFNKTSNESTLTINVSSPPPIEIPCDSSVKANGTQGVYKLNMNMGTAAGEAGIAFTAYGIPDKFVITNSQGEILAQTKYVGAGDNPIFTEVLTLPVYEYDNTTNTFVNTGRTENVDVDDEDREILIPDGRGTLTYNKQQTTEAEIVTIIVYGIFSDTIWDISGICPVINN